MLKKIGSFFWGLVEVLIVVYVIFVTSCILCRNKFGFTQFGSYTLVSMNELRSNALDTEMGNLLVVKYTTDIKVGDVIYFYAPDNEEYVINSLNVTAIRKDGNRYLYTVGDKGKTINSTRVLGKYANQYANLGTIKDTLESRLGFLLLVLLPIMIVFIYQIYQFVIAIKYNKNEEEVEEEEQVVDKEPKEEIIQHTKIETLEKNDDSEKITYVEEVLVNDDNAEKEKNTEDDIEVL